MSAKLIFSVVFLSGTLVFLSSCSNDDENEPISAKPSKSKQSSDLDRLILAPPELSLAQALKKYASSVDLNQSPRMVSRKLTEAADKACGMGDNGAGETLLNEALRLDGQNGEAYFQRGRARCNVVAGKDQEAMDDLNRAISLGAGGSAAHEFLARLYDANSQPIKAIGELSIAIKMSPSDKDLYKSRGAMYASQGEKEQALQDYDRLIKLDPTSLLAYFRKAQVLESMDRFDEARAVYEKLVSLDESKTNLPLKPIGYKRLAALNSARGKHEDAIKYLTKVAELDDSDEEPIRIRGLEYAKLKNYKKAIEDLTKSIEVSPECKSSFDARAEIYEQMGRKDLAEKDRIEAKRLHEIPAERPLYEMKSPTP